MMVKTACGERGTGNAHSLANRDKTVGGAGDYLRGSTQSEGPLGLKVPKG